MPSFVSRLEESIFAAAFVHFAHHCGVRTVDECEVTMRMSTELVERFREAEREAAKRAIPVAHPLRKTTAHE